MIIAWSNTVENRFLFSFWSKVLLKLILKDFFIADDASRVATILVPVLVRRKQVFGLDLRFFVCEVDYNNAVVLHVTVAERFFPPHANGRK